MTFSEVVLDCETDGLAYECSKIHILSYTTDGNEITHLKKYSDMQNLLSSEDTLFICHNAIRFDMVVFNRILGIPMDYSKWVDTLGLSWYLEPDRKSHGLDSYTQELSTRKPKVEDWENVTWEQMAERCGCDVETNWKLWQKQKKRTIEIYGT